MRYLRAILQSSNRPICGNLQIPQQNYLSSALVVFLCQRQARFRGGVREAYAKLRPSGQVDAVWRAMANLRGTNMRLACLSVPASPSSSASACCPLQSFGICRDNNQHRLCVVSKLGRSSCSPWVRVVSLLQSSHKYEHWHWQRGCLLLPSHCSFCCPLQLLLLLLLLSSEIN